MSATLTLIVNSSAFIGNEEDFTVDLTVLVDTSSNNSDLNNDNNQGFIAFSFGSSSNIELSM